MADKKISQLNEIITLPLYNDLLVVVDNPLSTPETKKITVANLLGTNWMRIADTATWISATSFSIDGDKTDFLKKRTKIRCVNSGIKFGVVLSSVYNSGTGKTTATLIPNTTFLLVSTGISGIDVSYGTPPDFPDFFYWMPSWTNLTITGSPIYSGRFSVIGTKIFLSSILDPAGGTIASTNGPYINNLPASVNGGGEIAQFADVGPSSKGMGYFFNGTTRLYAPAWSAYSYQIYISGSYYF
jgi:hypothetical protein